MTAEPFHPQAPAEGTALCALADIPDGGACERAFGPEHQKLRILLLRRGGEVWGYINECPHFSVPLNFEPDVFCTYNGEILMCAHHSAMFRFEDGQCIDGPCLGQALRKAPIRVARETVCWGEPDASRRESR